jgi:hypothetical protein
MPIETQVHMQRQFDLGRRSCDVEIQAIARGAHHRQAARLRKVNHSVIILLSGAEPRGELLHRQEPAVRRARRIVEIFEEAIQGFLVAERQNENYAQGLRRGKASHRRRLPTESDFAHMPGVQGK